MEASPADWRGWRTGWGPGWRLEWRLGWRTGWRCTRLKSITTGCLLLLTIIKCKVRVLPVESQLVLTVFTWQPQPTTACRGDPQPRQGGRTGGWDCRCVITSASTGTVSGRPYWRMIGRAVSRGSLQLQISNFSNIFYFYVRGRISY